MLNEKAQFFVEITTIRRKRRLDFYEIVPTNISALSHNDKYTTISPFNHNKKEKKALSPALCPVFSALSRFQQFIQN
eukprot:1981597-Ditylum_brightwellii.AAC.1